MAEDIDEEEKKEKLEKEEKEAKANFNDFWDNYNDIKSQVKGYYKQITDLEKSQSIKGKSIIGAGRHSIFYFPVFCSQSLTINEAHAIAKMYERVYADFVQNAISQRNRIVNEDDFADLKFLKQYHTNIIKEGTKPLDRVFGSEPLDRTEQMIYNSCYNILETYDGIMVSYKSDEIPDDDYIAEHKRNTSNFYQGLSYLEADDNTNPFGQMAAMQQGQDFDRVINDVEKARIQRLSDLDKQFPGIAALDGIDSETLDKYLKADSIALFDDYSNDTRYINYLLTNKNIDDISKYTFDPTDGLKFKATNAKSQNKQLNELIKSEEDLNKFIDYQNKFKKVKEYLKIDSVEDMENFKNQYDSISAFIPKESSFTKDLNTYYSNEANINTCKSIIDANTEKIETLKKEQTTGDIKTALDDVNRYNREIVNLYQAYYADINWSTLKGQTSIEKDYQKNQDTIDKAYQEINKINKNKNLDNDEREKLLQQEQDKINKSISGIKNIMSIVKDQNLMNQTSLDLINSKINNNENRLKTAQQHYDSLMRDNKSEINKLQQEIDINTKKKDSLLASQNALKKTIDSNLQDNRNKLSQSKKAYDTQKKELMDTFDNLIKDIKDGKEDAMAKVAKLAKKAEWEKLTLQRKSQLRQAAAVAGTKAVQMVKDTDIKKINGMLPYNINIEIWISPNSPDRDMRAVNLQIGIKTVLHLVDPADLEDELDDIMGGSKKRFDKIRLQTGEINWLQYIFKSDENKKDLKKTYSKNKNWIQTLKKLGKYKDTYGSLFKSVIPTLTGFQRTNAPIPNASMVLSAIDVDNIKLNTGYDFTKESTVTKFASQMFIILFAIIDSSTRTIKTLYPGESSRWDLVALDSIEDLIARSSNQDFMKELKRSINR